MENKTNLDKLKNVLIKAKKDLDILLDYVDCKNIEDFYNLTEKQKSNKTFHQIDDVLKQIKYINNIENQILLYNSSLLKG